MGGSMGNHAITIVIIKYISGLAAF